ncbi:MAG: NADH-quinone oxidoreductase subunit D [Myxococcota bacterium]|jgi:NADH-quinone oxidoreductase subunit D|nr:NADH-quinone oxidoreductase subunit NuoD [Deltaproteobacteria bacterium]MCP4241332.1 NADH-quinone oxidoreductase subunit D [bacterium]MDP6075835.1 NADH-quinone oxidoreductase subunit D [Myxococcota bacterium]MDP7075123.1 NADH-quinone oxidoreductase subunit D [Myxococcota bacterium]MDP7298739.1 NADH-quinone oxidoreductase subunit D [Myxococcota bacterium]
MSEAPENRESGLEEDFERDLHVERQILNMGPSHPATHGTVKFLVELDGENIADVDIQVGYLHRGFEKECEAGTWYQAIPYTDRLNYNSAVLANVGFVLAVEKLLGLEAPERCQWQRVLASELSRLADHLTRCGAGCLELAAMTPFLYGIQARELTWDLLEFLCGARVTSNYVRIGGVKHPMPDTFPARCRDSIAKIRALLVDFDEVVTSNRIFVDRLKGTGVISKEDCLRYAVTGPILRSVGVPLDVRKAEPYLVYEEIDFDVPVGEVGDNYDRYLVCVEEMQQSLRIVEQCLAKLERLGPGPVNALDPRVRWPAKGRVFNHMEELIQQFKSVTEGPRVPAGEAYFAVESANGELGFYLVSDGSAVPYKVRCRPPSFINVAPLPLMLRGALLADLIPTFDFINMIGGECDR